MKEDKGTSCARRSDFLVVSGCETDTESPLFVRADGAEGRCFHWDQPVLSGVLRGTQTADFHKENKALRATHTESETVKWLENKTFITT